MSIYYHVTLVIMLVKADVQLMPGPQQQWKYYEYIPRAINQNEEKKKNEEVKVYTR